MSHLPLSLRAAEEDAITKVLTDIDGSQQQSARVSSALPHLQLATTPRTAAVMEEEELNGKFLTTKSAAQNCRSSHSSHQQPSQTPLCGVNQKANKEAADGALVAEPTNATPPSAQNHEQRAGHLLKQNHEQKVAQLPHATSEQNQLEKPVVLSLSMGVPHTNMKRQTLKDENRKNLAKRTRLSASDIASEKDSKKWLEQPRKKQKLVASTPNDARQTPTSGFYSTITPDVTEALGIRNYARNTKLASKARKRTLTQTRNKFMYEMFLRYSSMTKPPCLDTGETCERAGECLLTCIEEASFGGLHWRLMDKRERIRFCRNRYMAAMRHMNVEDGNCRGRLRPRRVMEAKERIRFFRKKYRVALRTRYRAAIGNDIEDKSLNKLAKAKKRSAASGVDLATNEDPQKPQEQPTKKQKFDVISQDEAREPCRSRFINRDQGACASMAPVSGADWLLQKADHDTHYSSPVPFEVDLEGGAKQEQRTRQCSHAVVLASPIPASTGKAFNGLTASQVVVQRREVLRESPSTSCAWRNSNSETGVFWRRFDTMVGRCFGSLLSRDGELLCPNLWYSTMSRPAADVVQPLDHQLGHHVLRYLSMMISIVADAFSIPLSAREIAF